MFPQFPAALSRNDAESGGQHWLVPLEGHPRAAHLVMNANVQSVPGPGFSPGSVNPEATGIPRTTAVPHSAPGRGPANMDRWAGRQWARWPGG